jgi:hypothetical protein
VTENTAPAAELTCRQCGETKAAAEMALVKGKPIKTCKACKNAYSREWRDRNPERTAEYTRRKNDRPGFREEHREKMRARYHRLGPVANRDRQLQRNYGITLAEYEERLRMQGGVCAICGTEPMLADRVDARWVDSLLVVDHCHETGVVRGLLCSTCNLAIGYLKDDPNRMLSAAAYVLAQSDVLADLN